MSAHSKGVITLALIVALLNYLPSVFAYPNRPPSFQVAEKKWEAARSEYIKELDAYIGYLNQELEKHIKPADGGDAKIQDQRYEKFKDLQRERDKIRRRRGMMQLVSVVEWDTETKEVIDTLKDLRD